MDTLEESIKNERRRILSTLENWNVGIAPNGKLATDSCFVHSSIPDIIFNKNNKETIIESTFISTKSEWATNLVESSASSPGDTETIKSLSICNSIFRSHPAATKERSAVKSTEEAEGKATIHLIKHNVKAYVIVENIARLTKEFDDELTQAQEHWPHSPQKSWDNLCQIWNRYGFLWPQRVQIGFKIQESVGMKKEERTGQRRQDEIITSIKDHLKKKTQDTLLHSPKNYSVIWRTHLKPVHEFFPSKYDEKKEFINNVIHQFSYLVFNDSLIRLVNVSSGDYLGRCPHNRHQQQSYHQPDHSHPLYNGVTLIPSSGNNNTTSSNLLWKFNNSSSTINGSPYVFAGSKRYLCSGQYDTADLVVLSKAAACPELQQITQYSSIDNCYNTAQSRASINLVHHRQQQQQHIWKEPSHNKDDMWVWSIDISPPRSDYIVNGAFDLDKAVDTLRCLVHGDEITLKQQSMYLCAATRTAADPTNNFVSSISSSLTYNSPIPQGIYAKSPLSVSSFSAGDRYKFSSSSGSSTSTQPTSGSISFYTPTPTMQLYNTVNSSNKGKTYHVNHSKQSLLPSQNTTITPLVYIENVVPSTQKTNNALSADYRWRVEMVSKSIILETKKKQKSENDSIQQNVASMSVAASNNNSKDLQKGPNNPKIIYSNSISNTIKSYSPKLNLDITRCSTPDTTNVVIHDVHNRNQEDSLLTQVTSKNYSNSVIGVSVMVPDEAYYENLNQVLNQQQQFPKSQQQQLKSKWLDLNPTIYHLGATEDDDDNDIDKIDNIHQQFSMKTSQYETPMGSIQSITSPAASFVPASTEELTISEKQFEKQPLQQAKATPMTNFQVPTTAKFNKTNHSVVRSSSDSSDSSSWSSLSQSPSAASPTIDKNDRRKSTPAAFLTEAETFKRGIQKTYQEQANAHRMIFRNLFSASSSCVSSKSSTTSQIRYYDDEEDEDKDEDEDEEDEATEILDPASSQLRTYTMTPRSHRFISQPTTPSSSAFLTPEEYMKRKRSRENSFMLLLNQETKQQMWLRAIKQSTLSHWLCVLSKGTKKLHQKGMVVYTPPSSNKKNNSHISSGIDNHHFLNVSSDIKPKNYSNSHSNRIIQKKKGFYFKKSNSGASRRKCSIVL